MGLALAIINNYVALGSGTLTLGKVHNAFEAIGLVDLLLVLILLLVDKRLLELHLLLHFLLLISQNRVFTRLDLLASGHIHTQGFLMLHRGPLH